MTPEIAQARWSQVYAQSKIGGKEVHGVIISYGIKISIVFLITEKYMKFVENILSYILSIYLPLEFCVISKLIPL